MPGGKKEFTNRETDNELPGMPIGNAVKECK
jgi:hypothetical protein